MPGRDRAPSGSLAVTLAPLVLLCAMLAVVVRKFAVTVTNTDTFFHLRMGSEFLNGWSPWDPGTLSPFSTADWVPSQWLGQVALAAFEGWFGLPGVAWLAGACALLLVVVLYLAARAHAGPVAAVAASLVGVLVASPGLSPRPQVLSYVFVAVATSLWMRSVTTGRPPWVLVPLTWLWAMCHGMWPVGVLIGLASVAGAQLERPKVLGLRRGLLVPFLSLAAAGLTPAGPALYSSVLRVSSISGYFDEWHPPSFTEPAPLLGALMALTIVVLRLRRGQLSWPRLLLLVLAVGWLVYAQRTGPVAAAMLTPLLAAEVETLLPPRETRLRAPELAAVGGGLLLALLALALAVPHTSSGLARPSSAVDEAVRDLPAGTALLNDWDQGGYDVWRYPRLDVVMHGYGDMFTEPELARNLRISTLQPGWDEYLDDLGAAYALLPEERPLAYELTEDRGWQVVARDEVMVLLAAPGD